MVNLSLVNIIETINKCLSCKYQWPEGLKFLQICSTSSVLFEIAQVWNVLLTGLRKWRITRLFNFIGHWSTAQVTNIHDGFTFWDRNYIQAITPGVLKSLLKCHLLLTVIFFQSSWATWYLLTCPNRKKGENHDSPSHSVITSLRYNFCAI